MEIKMLCRKGICMEPRRIFISEEEETGIPMIIVECDYEKCPAQAKYKCTPNEDGRITICSR